MPRSRLLQHAALYTLANAITSAIPFLLLPLLTRRLSTTEYGLVSMFQLMLPVVAVFTGLNVAGAVGVRWYKGEESEFPRYVANCLGILLVGTLVVLAGMAAVSGPLRSMTDLPGPWLLAAVLVASAQVVIAIRLSLWMAKRQVVPYGLFQVSMSALNIGLSLVLVLTCGMGWVGRVTGMGVANGLYALIALGLMTARGEVRFSWSLADVANALRFGAPLVPHTLGTLMISSIGPFVVAKRLGVSEAGILNVGMQLGMVLGTLTSSFNGAFAPWLFGSLRADDPRTKARVVRWTYGYVIAIVAFAMVAGQLGPSVVNLLTGKAFHQASEGLTYIMMGFAFGGMYFMVVNYVFYSGRTGWLSVTTLGSGILNLVLCEVLTARIGRVGAAQAYMVSQAFLFVATWLVAQKVYPMPWARAVWKGFDP